MKLASIRIITTEAETLTAFYEKITGTEATRYTRDFAEIKTPAATLAIGSIRTLQFFAAEHLLKPAENRTCIIEFSVDDVDREYQRIKNGLSVTVIQPPTLMPWGNKSFLFRDPDDNIVNFFTPVSREALEKFNAE